MTGTEAPKPTDFYKLLLDGQTARSAVEVSIQKSLKSFVETSEVEIKKLLQSNVVPPDVSSDMQKLQDTMIQKTIELIDKSINAAIGETTDEETPEG